MRLILIFTMTMVQLFPTAGAETEPEDDCRTSCAADKFSRDFECPSRANQVSKECLQDSRDAYRDCVDSCPPHSAAPAVIRPPIRRYEA